MQNKEALKNFPESLRGLPQWVLWKFETRDGKVTKVPHQPNGRKAAVNRPEEWSTFDACFNAADVFDGVGFVFTKGYIGIDLDKCFENDGSVKEFAQNALLEFDSYTEVSPSGNGLHIIVQSDAIIDGRKSNGIECYSEGRFFTVTGNVYRGRTELRAFDVSAWHKDVFGERAPVTVVAPMDTGYLPEDEKILDVMFRSKNGDKMQTLYKSGNWSAAGFGSQSEADLSLVGSLMFFCRNNAFLVDRLFRRSKLMRGKWDEKHGRGTYGANTIQRAYKSEVMEWQQPKAADGSEPDFILSNGKNPKPLLILENVCVALDGDCDFQSRFRLNDFSHTIETRKDGEWLGLQDIDVLEAQRYISRKWEFFALIGKDMATDAIRYVAYKTRVNPPVDYLRSLTWDRVPRIEYWLHVVFGVPNDELNEKIGANWLKGLVSRILWPGCQFDQVLVLEGAQGWRKSTALRVLGSPWHVESTLSTDDRDFYMLLARNAIVEFSEGEIVGRTSARRLKAIITKTEDSYRAPYERGLQTFKRGCVFAMTTNDDDYQKDETGGRRWLPVVLTRTADIEWLKANRDQLYAEAVYRVDVMKETTYEYPQHELTELQKEKREDDSYAEDIVKWYETLPESEKEQGVNPLIAYNGAVDNSKHEMSKDTEWRIRRILKSVLELESRNKKIGGKVLKRWFMKNR